MEDHPAVMCAVDASVSPVFSSWQVGGDHGDLTSRVRVEAAHVTREERVRYCVCRGRSDPDWERSKRVHVKVHGCVLPTTSFTSVASLPCSPWGERHESHHPHPHPHQRRQGCGQSTQSVGSQGRRCWTGKGSGGGEDQRGNQGR